MCVKFSRDSPTVPWKKLLFVVNTGVKQSLMCSDDSVVLTSESWMRGQSDDGIYIAKSFFSCH